MKSILTQLSELFSQAIVVAFGNEYAGTDPILRVSADSQHGDYQCNVAMSLAKKIGAKPRDVAQKIVDALPEAASQMLQLPEIAGPGFINLRLQNRFIEQTLAAIPSADARHDDRLGVVPVTESARERVVIDYSAPNIAKQMHVGHLRSTIIGDTLHRVLKFAGHEVIPQNHLGDWGTQFGMVILGVWHLFMASRHGEVAEDLARRENELRSPNAAAVMKEIRDRQEADLFADSSGEFRKWLGKFEPNFDDLQTAYRFVNTLEKAAENTDLKVRDIPLARVSNHVVTMLQRRDPDEMLAWQISTAASFRDCEDVYAQLGVLLTRQHVRGESFFDPLLEPVVNELRAVFSGSAKQSDEKAVRAIFREDRGALCVFLEKSDGSPVFKGPQGDSLPMIVQKSDGAFLYSSTDIAAASFRINDSSRSIQFVTDKMKEGLKKITADLPTTDPASKRGGLGGTRILYVVGSPQKLHFEMLFAVIRALGWTWPQGAKHEVRLEHVMFGSVLGEDRKMLRTRSGASIKLKDLLDEAVQRAETQVRETEADPDKRRGFSEEEIGDISRTVGIGAVKYADLCQNRNTDYVFSWDKMLALQGNTAPYMLYAYARIRSIYRKAEEARPFEINTADKSISVSHEAERKLALTLLRLPDVIDLVAESLLPNQLCEFLYELAGQFMVFYETCPVLKAPDAATYGSRLRLCDLTARALKLGLEQLLGIKTLERM